MLMLVNNVDNVVRTKKAEVLCSAASGQFIERTAHNFAKTKQKHTLSECVHCVMEPV